MTGLDSDTEAEVAAALDRLTAGRTTFVISPTSTRYGTTNRSSRWSGSRSLAAAIPTRCWPPVIWKRL